MDFDLLIRLSKASRETRAAAAWVLDMAKEKDEIAGIAEKLDRENVRMIQDISSLRMDKAALVTFIEDNVSDEDLKNQILPKPNKGAK